MFNLYEATAQCTRCLDMFTIEVNVFGEQFRGTSIPRLTKIWGNHSHSKCGGEIKIIGEWLIVYGKLAVDG